MTRIFNYSVYGDRLASTLELPELDEITPGAARWIVTEVATLPPMLDATELGDDLIYGDIHARLFAHADGHRVVVEDTGTFDLSRDRQRILIAVREGAWPDFVRAHLTGRVLATLLYLDGLLPLHASAVATRDGVVGFMAPKGFGKSTLALALAKAGAWLVSDDTLPVDAASGEAWPGVHGLRVRDDTLAAVGMPFGPLRTREGKHVVTDVGQERVFARPIGLAALYLIAPVEPHGGTAERAPFPPALSAIGIVGHVKIGRMLGPAEAPTMLARAAAIVRRVPVYQLHVPRDLAILPATAATILGWHGEPTP